MGAVAMHSTDIGRYRGGSQMVEATLYVYCDSCGSFNVKTYIPFTKILASTILLIAAVLITLKNQDWLACFIPIGMIALLYFPWRDIFLNYRCKKCNNIHFANWNSLGYQAYDSSVLDVPDKLVQKRYFDEENPRFQVFL
jgi:hypothetical protein